MHPILFDSSWIGLEGTWHFTISSYVTFILLGFLLGCRLAYRDVRDGGLSHQQFIDLAIWMLIIGVLGSRLAHVLMDGFLMDYVHLCVDPFLMEGKQLAGQVLCETNQQCLTAQVRGLDIGAICHVENGLCYPQRDCMRGLKFWSGGMTVYGGLLGCLAFGYVYLKRAGVQTLRVMDVAGYVIAAGLAVGRLGCFMAGCCFGGVCDIDAISVRFPSGSLAYQQHFDQHYDALQAQWNSGIQASLPVYPTQVFESLYAAVIFAVVYFYVRPRKRYDGQLLLWGSFLYGICRFLVEFLRADVRGGFLDLSTSQLISLPIILVCGFFLWKKRGSGVRS